MIVTIPTTDVNISEVRSLVQKAIFTPTFTAEQLVHKELLLQMRIEVGSDELTEDEKQMIQQKFGLAAIKFTKIESQVIRKQTRRDERNEQLLEESEVSDAA